MALAQTGDLDAIGRLLNRYRLYLLLIVNEDIESGIRQKVGASDVVQESMIRAQRNFGQFAGQHESEFRGWLRAIVKNDLKKQNRHFSTLKRSVQREAELSLTEEPGFEASSDDPTPSIEMMRSDLEKSLSNAMTKLSSNHRDVIQLRNFDDLTFAEIGSKLNRSADAARKLWARTLRNRATTTISFWPWE